MSELAVSTRVLLLIEDNPGDATMVQETLSQARDQNYEIIHVAQIAKAYGVLQTTPVDVVVLDLQLPDSLGVDSVKRIREHAGNVPIVVLTGNTDNELALSCLNAGAADYLPKAEAGFRNLRRAIGYAIMRTRESQLRELRETLERYRSMSSATQGTTVTAALAGSGAIATRSPQMFEEIVRTYTAILSPHVQGPAGRPALPRVELERVATGIGDACGGPRDLIDVHIAALDRVMDQSTDSRSRCFVLEARLIALEMMGLLVDYYRVGCRRGSKEGATPW